MYDVFRSLSLSFTNSLTHSLCVCAYVYDFSINAIHSHTQIVCTNGKQTNTPSQVHKYTHSLIHVCSVVLVVGTHFVFGLFAIHTIFFSFCICTETLSTELTLLDDDNDNHGDDDDVDDCTVIVRQCVFAFV